jgi:hypothetical protein
MEVYRQETEEILRIFLAGQITAVHCHTALYTAFSGVLPRVGPDDVETVRAISEANNRTIDEEMERRTHSYIHIVTLQ